MEKVLEGCFFKYILVLLFFATFLITLHFAPCCPFCGGDLGDQGRCARFGTILQQLPWWRWMFLPS